MTSARGVGSFSNLKNLPMDYLKIDGSFMRNLARDTVNQAMVTAMIKLARTLNFKVIAEQVEDAAALEAARRWAWTTCRATRSGDRSRCRSPPKRSLGSPAAGSAPPRPPRSGVAPATLRAAARSAARRC